MIRILQKSYMPSAEVAAYLGIAEEALSRGDSGTDTLVRVQGENGTEYLTQEVITYKRLRELPAQSRAAKRPDLGGIRTREGEFNPKTGTVVGPSDIMTRG